MTKKLCEVPGCENQNRARGLCNMHYLRWKKDGDPGEAEVRHREDLSFADRVWAKVDRRGLDECWPWLGHINGDGYGRINADWTRDEETYGHRATYVLTVGPIPDGLQLDHLCRNRACCNPTHLEPVAPGENQRRGLRNQNTAKTHCKRGHEFTPDNTMVTQAGHRRCRECARAAFRADYWRDPEKYRARSRKQEKAP